MREEVKIRATDGSGVFSAFLAAPNIKLSAGTAPAVVVIQEIFGVNQNLRRVCAGLAEKGFLAICPDLFWRQEPGIQLTDQTEAEWQKAFQLYQGFNLEKGIDDLKATLAFVRTHDGCSGRAGTLGYCLGGKLAYLMATRSDAVCNVSYYGVGIEELLGEAENIDRPLLMLLAEKDKFVPAAAQAKIIAALKPDRNVEIHVYPGADHAFARIDGQHYDRAAAEKANDRTAAFLRKNLG